MTRKKRHHGEPETSRHHRMPDSRGGANEPPNKEAIKHWLHKAIHLVFGNQHTLEKFNTIIMLDDPILTDEFKRMVEEIIAVPPQEVYKMDAFANKHGYKSLRTET